MKRRIRFMLVSVAWAIIAASVPAVAQNSSDVEVSAPQWTYDVNQKLQLKGDYKRLPAPSLSPIQAVSATFRNVGGKPVKSLTWEYVVYEDSDPTKVVRIYKFRNKTLLRPGESERLSKEGLNIQHRRNVEARVIKVEYVDGTVWRRART